MEEHRHDCDVHEMEIKIHGQRLCKIDEILDKVRNRPPVWCTVAIGMLLAVCGWLAKGM